MDWLRKDMMAKETQVQLTPTAIEGTSFKQNEQALQEAIHSNPLNALSHHELGIFYLKQNQFENAMDSFGKALRISPELREAVIGYAMTCQLNGTGENAIGYCQSILNKNPNDAEVYGFLKSLVDDRKYRSQIGIESKQAAPEPRFSNRITLIDYLIERFGYRKYLEIGCRDDYTFSKVKIPYKVGIDPFQGGTLRMTSDAYFALTNDNFDLIFIDGLHLAEQVVRDIHNACRHLRNGGTIILHDCNPTEEIHQVRKAKAKTWNGDVWKGLVHYRQDPYLDIVVGNFDFGMGIIRQRLNPDPIRLPRPYMELRWSDLIANRQRWLKLSNAEQIAHWL